jgi:hypothetical protein
VTTRTGIYSDAIIAWPWESGAKLREIIGELQQLNPALGLRCATGEYREYLVHNGTERDVVTVSMPEPTSDEFTAGFTQLNYEWMPADTDLGEFRTGKRRFERTADGNLRIRPFTWELEENGAGLFNRARQRHPRPKDVIDEILRIDKSWFIFYPPHDEIWEVDFCFMPADLFSPERRKNRTNSEYWRTMPVGTISYIDEFDLPIEEHYARAAAIVVAGSEFAVVADMQKQELRIFRSSGVQISREDICIPEMPWFKIPVPRQSGDEQ